MAKKRSVFVTGATGQPGGAVPRRLIQLGHQVQALTRKPQGEAAHRLAAAGANITVGDFDDPAALTGAMKHVDAVFAMSTPYEGGADRENRLVALAIEQPERVLGQRIGVASDELTPAQMAESIGRVTGRSVGFVEFPLAQLRAMSAQP